ncbi:MAG: hypothetical protein Q9218_000619 [Villophora microphyllina]
MLFYSKRHPKKFLAFFLAFLSFTNATAVIRDDANQSRQLVRRDLVQEDVSVFATKEISPSGTSIIEHRASDTSLVKRQRLTLDQLWTRIRIGTLYLFWSFHRMIALTTSDPLPQGKFMQNLKRMYSQIRSAAINEWAKLPEQSSVRIVCGQLILTILPPADRTLPWSVVEEVAYSLFLMVSAGLGGLVTGTYLPIATSVAAWYYLQVIQPVLPGQAGVGAGGGISVGGRVPNPRKPPSSPPSRRRG